MRKVKFEIIASVLIIASMTSCKEDSTAGDKVNIDSLAKNLTLSSSFIKSDSDIMIGDTTFILSSGIPQTRDDLESMRTVVKIFNGSKNAGLTIPGFGGITLGKDETSLNIYYIETKIVNTAIDSIVYGIGYSVHYLFKKVKNGINLSNLPSIAASVQLESKKTQVHYSLQTYGIKSINLVKYFKPTVNKNFDVEGFGVMQSSIDGIQNILGDSMLSSSVKFTPEILKFIKPYDLN